MASTSLFQNSGKSKEAETSLLESQNKTIMNLSQRLKDLESTLDLFNDKLELLDHNSIKNFKRVFNEQKSIKSDLRDVKQELQTVKEFQKKVSKQFRLMATVDEVKKLEKYIDLWEPMQFVTKDELKDAQKKTLDELKKIIEEFLK